MCFGISDESRASGNVEACDNAINASLNIQYKKKPSWLSKNVHRVKKMIRPVVEMMHRHHRSRDLTKDDLPRTPEYYWDSDAEQMENDANEALECKFPECGYPDCYHCESYTACHVVCVPVFIPLVLAADADICLQEGGHMLTSSQIPEQQVPCMAM